MAKYKVYTYFKEPTLHYWRIAIIAYDIATRQVLVFVVFDGSPEVLMLWDNNPPDTSYPSSHCFLLNNFELPNFAGVRYMRTSAEFFAPSRV